jgi:hypothetical protein
VIGGAANLQPVMGKEDEEEVEIVRGRDETRGKDTNVDTPTFLGVSLAKVLIFSLTTEIPLSSDAFNSNTLARNKSGLIPPSLATRSPYIARDKLTRITVSQGLGSYLHDSFTLSA